MKINNIKLASLVLIASLFASCSSKNESITYNDNNQRDNQVITLDENVDDRLSNIKINELDIGQNDMSANQNLRTSYMNEVTSVIDGESITLTSIHFDFDNYQLKDEMIEVSNNNSVKISNVLSKNNNVKIKLEGNCDEWGEDEYNFALGLKRTKTVKQALINNGINASNIIVVSLGESNAICSEQTAQCWKQNRRVDHNLFP